MSDSSSRSGAAGGFLLALCAGLLALGLVLPSGGDDAAAAAGYHPMAAPARPVRLVVPALRLRAEVRPVDLRDDGVLDPPHDAHQVGWWQGSARPGARHGQTVLTGHTVHSGGGVMDHLGQLRRGKLVKVVTSRGTMVYRTTRTLTYSKPELARRAVDLFGQRHPSRLVLVTCSGWTGREYTRNVVVLARPLGIRDQKAA